MSQNNTDSRSATIEDFMCKPLMDEQTGIFAGVAETTLKFLLPFTKYCVASAGTVLQTQGEAADRCELRVVVKGTYQVLHVYPKTNEREVALEVALEEPGTLSGDVEMLLWSGVNELKGLRGLSSEVAWATIKAAEKGCEYLRIVPNYAFILAAEKDSRLALNLSKIFAIKLLRRNAKLDMYIASSPSQRISMWLYDYLKRKVNSDRTLEPDMENSGQSGTVETKETESEEKVVSIPRFTYISTQAMVSVDDVRYYFKGKRDSPSAFMMEGGKYNEKDDQIIFNKKGYDWLKDQANRISGAKTE